MSSSLAEYCADGPKLRRKAVALLSGGLDSTLAVKTVLEQGIDIMALNFFTPFCRCNRRSGCANEARRVANELKIPIKIMSLGEEYVEVVKNPKHGYGSNMNPCIDCRILMFRVAKRFMSDVGASFIVTGEVLGQRPMSQNLPAMKLVEYEAGLEGLVLRPLSAKLLSPTIPEKEGWISRERLYDVSGRSRKAQMSLADTLNMKDYPCPAGGCLLTDPQFAKRMRDLLEHTDPTINDIELLKVGRYFRLSPNCYAVVGRNERENQRLLQLARTHDLHFSVEEFMGPDMIVRGQSSDRIIELAAGIVARYSDAPKGSTVKVCYRSAQNPESRWIYAHPMTDEQLQPLRI